MTPLRRPDANPDEEPPLRVRRSRNLVGEIVDAITANIRDGLLKPGDKLPTETELVARFDVSRTVIREALSKLQAAERVQTRHGIGTFVRTPDAGPNFRITDADLETVADVISVLELRISLETEAAGLAALRRTDAHLAAMRTALAAFEDSMRRDSDAVPPDYEFHMEVARATGNRHFADLMSHLGTMIIPRARVRTPEGAPEGRIGYLQRVHGEHQRIYAAIRDGNVRAARRAMRAHLTNSRDRLQQAPVRPSV